MSCVRGLQHGVRGASPPRARSGAPGSPDAARGTSRTSKSCTVQLLLGDAELGGRLAAPRARACPAESLPATTSSRSRTPRSAHRRPPRRGAPSFPRTRTRRRRCAERGPARVPSRRSPAHPIGARGRPLRGLPRRMRPRRGARSLLPAGGRRSTQTLSPASTLARPILHRDLAMVVAQGSTRSGTAAVTGRRHERAHEQDAHDPHRDRDRDGREHGPVTRFSAATGTPATRAPSSSSVHSGECTVEEGRGSPSPPTAKGGDDGEVGPRHRQGANRTGTRTGRRSARRRARG